MWHIKKKRKKNGTPRTLICLNDKDDKYTKNNISVHATLTSTEIVFNPDLNHGRIMYCSCSMSVQGDKGTLYKKERLNVFTCDHLLYVTK